MEDLIFEDIAKTDELSLRELKHTFKMIKTQHLQSNEEMHDYMYFTTQILTYQEQDTGAFLIHYACEFDCTWFLVKIKIYHGSSYLMAQL